MKLHPLPTQGRFYCGPAAIAALTGLHPKEEVRAAINKVRGRAETQGVIRMFANEVMKTLLYFGFSVRRSKHDKKLTLKEFVAANPTFCGVLYVTGHFVAVSNGLCIDNKSLIARPVAVFPGNRKRLIEALEVSKG